MADLDCKLEHDSWFAGDVGALKLMARLRRRCKYGGLGMEGKEKKAHFSAKRGYQDSFVHDERSDVAFTLPARVEDALIQLLIPSITCIDHTALSTNTHE